MKKKIDIQITSGRGPAECCWVVSQVLKEMLCEARARGMQADVLHRKDGDLERTLVSARLRISGGEKETREFAHSWIGSIQWTGQSPYRRHHRRKNWFVGVEEISGQSVYADIKDKDIRYEAIRSSGPGGQNVNKVSTAVRALHLPTGTQVVASDSRSQLQNKKAATNRLKAKLAKTEIAAAQQSAESDWQQHNILKRGNPIRCYRRPKFKCEKGGFN